MCDVALNIVGQIVGIEVERQVVCLAISLNDSDLRGGLCVVGLIVNLSQESPFGIRKNLVRFGIVDCTFGVGYGSRLRRATTCQDGCAYG